MTQPILMPALSPTMEEGRLARWLVREGDAVTEGDVLAEIETDKATMDFEATQSGRILRLLIDAGTAQVPVNTPIALFEAPAVDSLPPAPKPPTPQPNRPAAPARSMTHREALRAALATEMRQDDRVFLIGEEVGDYQGVYKVSQGLLEEFGPRRVVDTPVTESAFAGLGVGAAFAGLRPVVEFMNMNFAFHALDQIVQSAAKASYLSDGRLACPIVFRGPHGPAARTGAHLSQDLAGWFAQIPGLKVVAPYDATDAHDLLRAAIRDPGPVVFLESESLYGQSFAAPEPENTPDTLPLLGHARLHQSGSDVTLVSFGAGMIPLLEAANTLAEQGLSAEVINLRSLRPLDLDTLCRSVQKTHRCVTLELGPPAAGIGAQIAAGLMQRAFDWLDAPVITLGASDTPMPYAAELEALALPTATDVVRAAREVCYR